MQRYRHQPNWVIKADIQQFFDTLSWALLLNQLERLQLKPGVVQWIEQQLKAGVVLEGSPFKVN
jgi:retron-type reverse transcriptase